MLYHLKKLNGKYKSRENVKDNYPPSLEYLERNIFGIVDVEGIRYSLFFLLVNAFAGGEPRLNIVMPAGRGNGKR